MFFFEKNCIKNVHFSILSFHLFYNFKLFFDLTFKLITKFCWVIESYNWLPICETKNASNRPTSMIRLNWRNHLLLKWPSTLEKAFFSWAASASSSSSSSMSAPEMERKPLLRKERRLQRRDSYEGSAIAFKDFLQNKFRVANFFKYLQHKNTSMSRCLRKLFSYMYLSTYCRYLLFYIL